MKDPYETLGVARSATDKEIKDAFKKLARKFHPDLHPGDKEAEAKFKDISAANDLLRDKEKRRRFDAGEIDASGAERPQERFYRDFADGPVYSSHAAQDGFANNEELEEFLARAFASGGHRSQASYPGARPGCELCASGRISGSSEWSRTHDHTARRQYAAGDGPRGC